MTPFPDPALGRRADAATAVTCLVPAVPEVPALLAAAERVLAACAAAEDDRAERALWIARAADAWTVPVGAVVGSGLPAPLAGRAARRALSRLGATLRPAFGDGPDRWTDSHGAALTAFHLVAVDPADRALLDRAATQLTSARRRREGALAAALTLLGEEGEEGEPLDEQHPAALGCLLAVLVPVEDPDALVLHRAARAPHRPLDDDALDAHRRVGARVLARLRDLR